MFVTVCVLVLSVTVPTLTWNISSCYSLFGGEAQCSALIDDFRGLSLGGCYPNASKVEKVYSVLNCARTYLAYKARYTYIYRWADHLCYWCTGKEATSLGFNSQDSVFFLRRATPAQNFTSGIYFGNLTGLLNGSVVHATVTPATYSDTTRLFICLNISCKDIHLNARFLPVSTTDSLDVLLYSRVKTVWSSPKKTTMSISPLNQSLRIFVLATLDRFLIYVNEALCCNMTYALPLTTVDAVQLYGPSITRFSV
ncbi:uncharacterized protein LOC131946373 [Physella acuta]|uniref:uncharacterized protein LOC131946346 n=1 Tax=Physella acuta TaxID=109671 RepID=UPI0027DE6BDB|nr:uncharacterized protein LOC131946346 [Physella acuta]XP_059163072.1 uncharacterized protein LOC131946373 [Physella acuta]